MKKVCIVGGGAAGLMAAYAAAKNGNDVLLFEKNEKLGKKIYITGKGRCNITNDMSRIFGKCRPRPKISYGRRLVFSSQKRYGIFCLSRSVP